ncbi:MAG: NrdH-redoxin [Gammaproteobacteria bacterium]|nr:NrdH-redoxin [Gammaproteobacteria bacterium]MBU1623620.1 NrdH-redoxin [Gammaproteobacteria bacterium]
MEREKRLGRSLQGLLAIVLLLWVVVGAKADAAQAPDIEVFVQQGCPHCGQAKTFLAQLVQRRPELRIVIRDVSQQPAAMQRLQQIAQQNGGAVRVPTFLVRGQLVVGYSTEAATDRLILDLLAAGDPAAEAMDSLSCDSDEPDTCGDEVREAPRDYTLQLFGHTLALQQVGLPLFTLTLGLLDGFNPCSMWVLLLMLSLLAPLNDRKRMFAVAGTFVAVQGIAYFLFLAAWLNLFLLVGLSRISEIVIASLALFAGALNLKDFFAFGRGLSLSIPQSAKPGIYQRIRGILQAKDLAAAILATIVLGVLVQIVELMCTSGFPALFTRILTLQELDGASYYGYLLLYDVAYMLDDLFILAVGVYTLSQRRLQEKEGRLLKLMSGLVMVGLGVYLLLPA